MSATAAIVPKRTTGPWVRLLVLRLLPVMFGSVLLTSTLGGVATGVDPPYRIVAVAAGFLYFLLAAAPWLLLVRLLTVALSSLAWLGRMTWYIVEDIQLFAWTSTYAAVVLGTLVCSAVMWSMTADWLVLRSARE